VAVTKGVSVAVAEDGTVAVTKGVSVAVEKVEILFNTLPYSGFRNSTAYVHRNASRHRVPKRSRIDG
jgi:hypothetical protein